MKDSVAEYQIYECAGKRYLRKLTLVLHIIRGDNLKKKKETNLLNDAAKSFALGLLEKDS